MSIKVRERKKSCPLDGVLGAVDLKLETSLQLQEKTNREGFVINSAYRRLRQMVLGTLAVLETERQIDERKLRIATSKPTEGKQGITRRAKNSGLSLWRRERTPGPHADAEKDPVPRRSRYGRPAGLGEAARPPPSPPSWQLPPPFR
jgi:hypothetical protein